MAEAKSKAKQGVHDTEPYRSTVDRGAYPERTYGEAISKEHKAHLEELTGVRVTPSVETAQELDTA